MRNLLTSVALLIQMHDVIDQIYIKNIPNNLMDNVIIKIYFKSI